MTARQRGANELGRPVRASDSPASDPGVEGSDAWPAQTAGVWAGFLMGADPSAYNLTDYVIQAGDALTLFVDARDSGTANAALQSDLRHRSNAGS